MTIMIRLKFVKYAHETIITSYPFVRWKTPAWEEQRVALCTDSLTSYVASEVSTDTNLSLYEKTKTARERTAMAATLSGVVDPRLLAGLLSLMGDSPSVGSVRLAQTSGGGGLTAFWQIWY